MSLRDLLSSMARQPTATDRRLINALSVDPRQTAFLSANEIAQRAGVDPATAVRFARKLGFGGYPALRAKLQHDLFGVSEAADRMRKRIKRLGKGSVLKTFVDAEIQNLSRLPEQVSDADIMLAARAVMRARQTFLFAVGHAATLAYLLESRLGRAGYRTQMLKHVARDAAANLLQAGARDAVILFALNAAHPLVPRIIAHARSVGATSILISDVMGLPLRQKPDIALVATRGADSEPRSLCVPMAICNAMVLHLSRLDKGRTLRNLERLDAVRNQLEPLP